MREDDQAEIAATFRDCHADLVSYFVRQHVDADSAADLAAESFLQLLRRMGEGTRPDVLRAYLFGIAPRVGMAARLSIPLGTVRSRIHHAVALLRSRAETY